MAFFVVAFARRVGAGGRRPSPRAPLTERICQFWRSYEFQSGGVVEMLEKLEDKFRGELHDLEKAEILAGQESPAAPLFRNCVTPNLPVTQKVAFEHSRERAL